MIDQIKAQLDRLVPVHKVVDLTEMGRALERELMLIKVRGGGEDRVEALRLADAFRARVIDASIESFVFELTGRGRQARPVHRADAADRARRGLAYRNRCDRPWPRRSLDADQSAGGRS